MSEQNVLVEVPCLAEPECGRVPAEDATSEQTAHAQECSQAEGECAEE